MAIDRLVLDRLMFAKYVLAAGRREIGAGTEHGAWSGILQLHDAADTFLLCITDHLGIPRKYRGLADYADAIDKHLKETGIGKALLHSQVLRKELNDLRDSTKHRGIYPRIQHVREVSRLVEPFFEANALQYFGVSFAALSLAEMIEDDRIKLEVKAAEEHMAASNFREAIAQCAGAFALLLDQETDRFESMGGPKAGVIPRELVNSRAIDEFLKDRRDASSIRNQLYDVNRAWHAAVERLDVVALGVNPVQYQTFKSLTPIVHLTYGKKALVNDKGPQPLLHTRENAEFCLDFVLDAVGRAQSAPRLAGGRGTYTIRALKRIDYHQYPNIQAVAGTIEEGTVIERAEYGGTGAAFPGGAWSWVPQGQERCLAPFDAFERVVGPHSLRPKIE